TPTTTAMSTVQEVIRDFFKKHSIWSLLPFLQYRKGVDSFTYDKAKEHRLYKSALELLSEDDEEARKCLFNYEDEKDSACVGLFWSSIMEKLCESQIKGVETNYDLTLATEVTQQMSTYVKSTTGRVAKRYSESFEQNSSKRLAKDSSEPVEDAANNPFLYDSNAIMMQTLDPALQQYA
ncbi:6580_t:CDS:2, partial [Paraglomus occultum]